MVRRTSRKAKRARAEPEPVQESDEKHPVSEGEDDDETLSALDTTTDEDDDADRDWASGETDRPARPVATYNQAIVHVPYDGAMPNDELQSRLAAPLDLGPVTLTADQLTLVHRSAEALERTYKVHTNRSQPGSGKVHTHTHKHSPEHKPMIPPLDPTQLTALSPVFCPRHHAATHER